MSTSAILAKGTVIAVGDGGSPESFTSITEIASFDGPDITANPIDVTDLLSAAREYKQGLEDGGTLSIPIMYISANAQHAQLRDDAGAGTERNYRMTFSDSSTATFPATVNGFTLAGAVDDVLRAVITLKLAGAITWA